MKYILYVGSPDNFGRYFASLKVQEFKINVSDHKFISKDFTVFRRGIQDPEMLRGYNVDEVVINSFEYNALSIEKQKELERVIRPLVAFSSGKVLYLDP